MAQITHHASTRMQQRGIPFEVVDALIQCGAKTHDHRSGVIRFFDKNARGRLKKSIGDQAYRRIENLLDAYAVVGGNGMVVTVGHRFKRINRH